MICERTSGVDILYGTSPCHGMKDEREALERVKACIEEALLFVDVRQCQHNRPSLGEKIAYRELDTAFDDWRRLRSQPSNT